MGGETDRPARGGPGGHTPATTAADAPSAASRWARCALVPGLLAGVLFFQALAFIWSAGITYDETYYLNAGLRVARRRDTARLSQGGVAPLPVLLAHAIPSLWSRKPTPAGDDMWESAPGDLETLRIARLLHLVLVGLPLVLVVYGWLALRRGVLWGLVGGLLLALSPSVVANCALATQDCSSALFTLVALACLARYRQRPSRRSYLWFALAFGLALSAKFTALFLLPVAGLCIAEMAWHRAGSLASRVLRSGASALGRTALAFGIALLLCWGLYGFRFCRWLDSSAARTPDSSLWVKVLGRGERANAIMDAAHRWRGQPAVLQGILFQVSHSTEGHEAFLCGRISQMGWWYYFPVAFLLKGTPAELLLALLAAPLLLRFLAGRFRGKPPDPTAAVWVVAGSCFALLALMNHINIGLRLVFFLQVLLVLWTVDQLASLQGRRRIVLALGCLLVLSQSASAVAAAPRYLSYFNLFAGGPKQGYRYLADSNLDWGQDLPALRDELRALGYGRIILAYFGTDRPSFYGIRSLDWRGASARNAASADAIAISATMLDGLMTGGLDPFKPFRELEPTSRAGYSIFIYALDRGDVRRALAEAIARRPSDRQGAGNGPAQHTEGADGKEQP